MLDRRGFFKRTIGAVAGLVALKVFGVTPDPCTASIDGEFGFLEITAPEDTGYGTSAGWTVTKSYTCDMPAAMLAKREAYWRDRVKGGELFLPIDGEFFSIG